MLEVHCHTTTIFIAEYPKVARPITIRPDKVSPEYPIAPELNNINIRRLHLIDYVVLHCHS
jgi:hypothetical protein